MALQVNSTFPTVINVNQGSDFTIDFPTGTETVPLLSKIGQDGSTVYYYDTTFEHTYSTTYSKYLQLQINGVFLTSSMQEVYKTGNSSLYNSYRASFSNGVLTLEQYKYKQGTSSSSSKLNLMGSNYTGTFSPNTSLTVLKANKGGTITSVWGKPYSLSVTNNSGTSAVSVVVSRTSSPNQHASTGTVSAGSNKIYHGDVLNITVTPVSGYKLTTFTINGTSYASSQTSAVTKTITVSGAVTVVVAATPAMQKLISPDIQLATLSAADICRVKILNENNVTVTAYLEFYDVNDSIYGSESANISANTADDIWITLNSSGQYDSGWYVEAYFEASGYQDSDTSTLVGR